MSADPSPAAPPPAAPPPAPALDASRERSGRLRIVAIGVLFVAVLGCVGAWRWWTAGDVETDDAFVEAEVVPVAAMVGGQVASIEVSDNARVKKGDVLVRIDPVELEARFRQAEGELAAATAQADAADAQLRVTDAAARGGLSSAAAQVTTARAQVGTAQAQIASADAQLARARSDAQKADVDLARGRTLAADEAISKERLDALEAAARSAEATVAAAEGQLLAAREARLVAASRVQEASGLLDTNTPVDAKIAAAQANADLAHARVTTARAALDLAALALSRATVVAPADGTVSKLSIRVGQVLVPGQQVGFLVPDATYVVANFKETQIGGMAVGQVVDVEVDTFPGVPFEGVVESLAAGTGSRFSVLAPDNASGNFVKVVQRVPVRIRWGEVPPDVVVRPGMSAVVTVHTR